MPSNCETSRRRVWIRAMLAAMASGAPGFVKPSQSTQTTAAAGGGRTLSKYRVKLAGRQLLHQFGPPWTVLQHRATGFRKDELPGVPEVGRPRGDRNLVLNGLARQQFRFEPGMQDDAGFG